MTCIVGVKTESGVLLAGDSLGSNGYSGTSYLAPKVFRLSRQVAAGYTTSFRMGQLLEHHLELPPLEADADELRWAIAELVPAIRECFKSHGYAHVQNNEEHGGTFLLAVRHRLFMVQPEYSVLETSHPFDAVGSGQDFACGAMYALYPRLHKKPKQLLTAALDAASEFAVGVSAPYSYTSTTG